MQQPLQPSGQLIANHLVSSWFQPYLDELDGHQLAMTFEPHVAVLGKKYPLSGALGCVIDYAVRTLGLLSVGSVELVDYELSIATVQPLGRLRVNLALDTVSQGLATFHSTVWSLELGEQQSIAEAWGTLRLQPSHKRRLTVAETGRALAL